MLIIRVLTKFMVLKVIKSTSFLVLGVLLFTRLYAQIPLQKWVSQPCFEDIRATQVVGNIIFNASSNGFFYHQITDNTPTVISTTNTLSRGNISALGYTEATQTLIIGHENGAIDFVKINSNGSVIDNQPLNALVNAEQVVTAKRINHILVEGNEALLSCSFGIVSVDVARRQIRETYQNIGPNGAPVAVLQTARLGDSLVALTSRGLLMARYASNVNLQYFANWHSVHSSFIPTKIVVQNNRLWVLATNQIWQYNAGKFTLIQTLTDDLTTLSFWNQQAVIGTQKQVILPNNTTLPIPKSTTIVMESATSGWIATAQSGFYRFQNGKITKINPVGLSAAVPAATLGYVNTLVAASGSFVDVFEANQWSSIGNNSKVLAYNTKEKLLYVGGEDGKITQQKTNGGFEAITGQFLGLTGMVFDDNQNLWLSTMSGLWLRRNDGTVSKQSLFRSQFNAIYNDTNSYKWLIVNDNEGGGLLIFDTKNNRQKLLNTSQGNGNLPSSTVRQIVQDHDGAMWIATDRGVAVIENTANVFTNNIDAYTPIFEGQKLLANDDVTAIAIDGGNRKWFGTRNGLYLFSSDGGQLIEKYTENNSFLPTNYVLNISIVPQTGNVFVTTPQGVASYVGTAIEPKEILQEVKIYPNPVRPDFNGTIGIDGLTADCIVKITDLAGQLVHQTRAQGGRASWNLVDYQGNKTNTGVYLVLIATPDGTERLIGKLAVVR
jgi:Two component regulator propeller